MSAQNTLCENKIVATNRSDSILKHTCAFAKMFNRTANPIFDHIYSNSLTEIIERIINMLRSIHVTTDSNQ